MIKTSLIFLFFSVAFFTFGQSNRVEDNQNKICIDSIHTKLLIGKWYDFSTDFYVEQVNFIKIHYKQPKHIRDSTSFKGYITFNPDGSFEIAIKTKDASDAKYTGTWMIVPKTRHLKLFYANSTYPQIWTILELNREAFIIKRGIR